MTRKDVRQLAIISPLTLYNAVELVQARSGSQVCLICGHELMKGAGGLDSGLTRPVDMSAPK